MKIDPRPVFIFFPSMQMCFLIVEQRKSLRSMNARIFVSSPTVGITLEVFRSDSKITPIFCWISESSPIRYHQICRENLDLLCFRGDIYLCLCGENHTRVECFLYDDGLDRCSHCLAGGRCLKGDLRLSLSRVLFGTTMSIQYEIFFFHSRSVVFSRSPFCSETTKNHFSADLLFSYYFLLRFVEQCLFVLHFPSFVLSSFRRWSFSSLDECDQSSVCHSSPRSSCSFGCEHHWNTFFLFSNERSSL